MLSHLLVDILSMSALLLKCCCCILTVNQYYDCFNKVNLITSINRQWKHGGLGAKAPPPPKVRESGCAWQLASPLNSLYSHVMIYQPPPPQCSEASFSYDSANSCLCQSYSDLCYLNHTYIHLPIPLHALIRLSIAIKKGHITDSIAHK